MSTTPSRPATDTKAKMDRAIAEKVMGHEWQDDRLGYKITQPNGHYTIGNGYSPTTNAAQAFELVERFQLGVCWCTEHHEWSVDAFVQGNDEEAHGPDLKIAICLCILKMHGVREEDL